MNTIIITNSEFRNGKKEIESDYVKFSGKRTFIVENNSIEYKIKPITKIASNCLDYQLEDNSLITIIGEITGIDNKGFIEVNAIEIREE